MNKTKKLIFLLNNDFRGFIFLIIKKIGDTLNQRISTRITYIVCLLKEIKVGKGIRFFGIPIIDRVPLSKIKIGNNCTFRSNRTTNWSHKKKMIIRTYMPDAIIQIGDGTGANGSVIVSSEKVIIGSNVLIGFNCYIADTDSHPVDPIKRHTGLPDTSPVKIEDNVWLGANVVVLKGVTIGKNTVIGSNSLVLSNIPANVIAIGNPCRVVKKLD